MLNFAQTGRMGEEAPAENIIATLVAVTGSYAFPLAVPFVHRYSRGMVVRTVLFLTLLSALSVAVFSSREVFDEMHQKRLFVIHMENVGSSSLGTECKLIRIPDYRRRAALACRCRG